MDEEQEVDRSAEEKAVPPDRGGFLGDLEKPLKILMSLAAAVGLLAALIAIFVPDVPQAALVALITLPLAGIILVWMRWRSGLLPIILTALIVVAGFVVGYLVIEWVSQPRFEITALDTLPGDNNIYELTDMLIWNYENLEEHGVEMTFPIQVRPFYQGNQRFGKVVAIVSGRGHCGDEITEYEEIDLWDDFDKEAGTNQIRLSLAQVVALSGLEINSYHPENQLSLGDRPFHESTLVVHIASAADQDNLWSCQEIVIRNSPWDFRSELVSRDGGRDIDVFVKNLGGTGEFTVHYRLVRLLDDLEQDENPMTNAVTDIASWNAPGKLVHLEEGEFFTDTVRLPEDLALGRYQVEVYAVKKQDFVRFDDQNARWEDTPSLPAPWWFGRYPYDVHVFIDDEETVIAEPAQSEVTRLHGQGIDLGELVQIAEEEDSHLGTRGSRYLFEKGEIIVHGGVAYAIYGPIFEHVSQLQDEGLGFPNEGLGFPISAVESVTSGSGREGIKLEFEGLGDPSPPTVIYDSPLGTGLVEGWIRAVYDENGGHEGWLGFPISDFNYHPDSTIQHFEGGYIVYYYPLDDETGERDYDREPIIFPYYASRGKIFDVMADESWQDTGVYLERDTKVTVEQLDGFWTSGGDWYDANGDPGSGLADERPLPATHGGVLIGRISEDGDPMALGRSTVFWASREGNLQLMMNSGSLGDNEGQVTVQIITDH